MQEQHACSCFREVECEESLMVGEEGGSSEEEGRYWGFGVEGRGSCVEVDVGFRVGLLG